MMIQIHGYVASDGNGIDVADADAYGAYDSFATYDAKDNDDEFPYCVHYDYLQQSSTVCPLLAITWCQ